MNPPTHLCAVCGSDDLIIHHDRQTIRCRACRHERTIPNDKSEIFLALNQRIDTIKDALLEQQETISKLLTGLELQQKITRALIRKVDDTDRPQHPAGKVHPDAHFPSIGKFFEKEEKP